MVELDQEFIEIVKENYPINKDKIIEAYKYANEKHDGVTRKSGEPYIIHPVAISKILIENSMDYSTIMAGLLHDVVEDTDVTLEEIKERFGETVAKLVDGVTKIDEIKLKAKNLGEEESIKNLLIAMGNDIRVIFIKLADRLHNMRTIEYLKREKQIKMATETQELFIPIAERIGVRKLRSELQSLTFRCLYPEEYKTLKTELVRKLTKRKDQVDDIEKKLNQILIENKIKSTIIGWPEHTYSVFKKIRTQGFDKISCLMLFKVIVPTEADCYKTMGLFHKYFKPVPAQVKDYIADPKPNGYQSLHTVMISEDADIAFKVMIRTENMDKVCEFGIASFWKNKDTFVKYDDKFEKHNTLKDIIISENTNMNSTASFIDAIKTDLTPDKTWILTPQLKPVCVYSSKPTVIDFAYAIHTKIGNNAVGALVNGKKTSLSTILKRGDVVEVLLSEHDKSPSRNWLAVVKSANARKKIREFINKNTTNENIKKGKELLKKELEKIHYNLSDVVDVFAKIQKEFYFVDLEDMYASIGYESVTISQILNYVLQKSRLNEIIKTAPVIVDSDDFADIFFPKCCCPILGDDIIGVMSKNGITIHTNNCVNLKDKDASKFVSAKWKEKVERLFDANIKIVAKDTVGCASKILGFISKHMINITKIVAKKVSNSDCEFDISVQIKNKQDLEKLMINMRKIPDIKTIIRSFD